MSAWEHPAKDLFRAGQGGMAPNAADRERVRARLAAKLGAAAVGVALTTTSASAGGASGGTGGAAAAKGGSLALFLKIALPIVVVGAAASIAPRILAQRDRLFAPTTVALASPSSAPTVTSEPPEETVSVVDLPSAPKAVATTAPKAVATTAPKKPASPDPADEARLVAAIDDALRSHDAAGALALADEHARRFPDGVLVEEREGGRAIARCLNGSRSSADAFLAAHPRSPMKGRIVAACGTRE